MGHGWSAEADDPAAGGAVSPASSGAAAAAADLSHPSSPEREHDIFVSFRSDEGAEIIRNVTATFEPLGLKVFNPVLQLKDPSAEEMRRHVSRSRVCVVVITAKYFESKWCCIEALAAMEANVPIIPVYDGTKYLYAHGPPNDRNPMYWKAEHPGYHSLAKGDEGQALRNFVFRRNLLPATSDVDQAKATADLIAAVKTRVHTLGDKLGHSPVPPEVIPFDFWTPPPSDDSEDETSHGLVALAPQKKEDGSPSPTIFSFAVTVSGAMLLRIGKRIEIFAHNLIWNI